MYIFVHSLIPIFVHSYSIINSGEEKGLKKGLEQGEEKNKRETAIKMLMDGLSLDTIQKYTSLSEKEIQKLQK